MTRESLSEYVTFYSGIVEDRNDSQRKNWARETGTFRDRGGPETGEGLSYARDRKQTNVAVM